MHIIVVQKHDLVATLLMIVLAVTGVLFADGVVSSSTNKNLNKNNNKKAASNNDNNDDDRKTSTYYCSICSSDDAVTTPTTRTGTKLLYPDLVIDNTTMMTCQDLLDLGRQGHFDELNCYILQSTTNLSYTCGCPCYICGSESKRISKPDAVVDISHSFIAAQATGSSSMSCLDLEGIAKGNSYLYEANTCISLQRASNPTCGCDIITSVGGTCFQATNISLGDRIFASTKADGMAPWISSQFLSPCVANTNYAAVWFRFVGTGAMVQADTCETSFYRNYLALISSTCNECLVPTTSGPCGTNNNNNNNNVPNNVNGFSMTWFAELGQEYFILVSDYFPDESGEFILSLTSSSHQNTSMTNAAPSSSPTIYNPYYCNFCGTTTHGVPLNPNAVIVTNASTLGNVTCHDLIQLGISTNSSIITIDRATCLALQSSNVIQQTCGCQDFVSGGGSCQDATTVTTGQRVYGSTIGRGSQPLCSFYTFADGVWFQFTGTGSLVTIDTCYYADFATSIAVVEGNCNVMICDDSSLAYSPCNSDTNNAINGTSVSFLSILDKNYHVLVYGRYKGTSSYPSATGNFALTISERTDPLPTSSPTASPPIPLCTVCGGAKGKRVVTNVDALVVIASLGKISCGTLQDSVDRANVSLATCHDFMANMTMIQQTCGCQDIVEPQTCHNAPLVEMSRAVYVSTAGARIGPGSDKCPIPNERPGAFFRFVGNNKTVMASTCRFNSFYTTVYVFTGNCTSLFCAGIPSNDDTCTASSPQTWFAELGREYFIFVTNTYYPEAEPLYFALTITQPPPETICNVCGDNQTWPTLLDITFDFSPHGFYSCAEALSFGLDSYWSRRGKDLCLDLPSSSYYKTCGCQVFLPKPNNCTDATNVTLGETVYASTISSNFMVPGNAITSSCGNISNTPGAWFRFVGMGGAVEVNTCRFANFDTKLSVYSAECGSLVCVDSNDDYCDDKSRVVWFAAQGEEYLIRVHGYKAAVGNFALTVSLATSLAPTSSPTTSIFPQCNICGTRGRRVTLNRTLIGPMMGGLNCSALEVAGLTNRINTIVCSVLLQMDLATKCGCMLLPDSTTPSIAPSVIPSQTAKGPLTTSSPQRSQAPVSMIPIPTSLNKTFPTTPPSNRSRLPNSNAARMRILSLEAQSFQLIVYVVLTLYGHHKMIP